MMPGFQSRFVESICDQDGRNWKLLTPIIYCAKSGQIYIVPRGASTDGASTPAIIASIYPPFGAYWQSAILHDSCYQNTLRAQPAGFQPASGALSHQEVAQMPLAALAKEDCDLLLLEAMELSGVDETTARVIYEGVKLGGASSFKADRS
jgi:hypothetical protein